MISKEGLTDYFREYEKLEVEAIPRELKVPLRSEFVISIIGPRRAGKTYYLLSLRNKLKNVVYLNFEDTRLYEATYKEIRDIIRTFIELYGKIPKYLFFDEIQNVENWDIAIRELHNLKKYRMFITGSSSRLLSKEISTRLRGRTLSFVLLPFSFREYLSFKKIKVNKILSKDEESSMRNLLRDYLEFGGFPDVVKSDEKIKILKEYSELILFRDFVERHKIRNIELARIIHQFVLQNFSNEISLRSLFNKIKGGNVKVTKDSVYNYVTNLEDTSFFFFLKKFSFKPHLRETWPKKIYLCDTGLSKIVRFSPDIGKLMENLVFLEYLRKENKDPLLNISYLKLRDGEVDFVIKRDNFIKELVQVSYSSSLDEIDKRELKSLIKGEELLKCKNLIVITWDFENNITYSGKKIKFIPLWKWLLKTK